jgi:23S rRNA pseudouridine1911/1915/1917 synthase
MDTVVDRPDDVPPGSVMRLLRVPPELAGMRLDRFVQAQLRETSRSRSQQIVRAGAYTTAGARLRKNHRVRAEERVVLWRAPWDERAPVDVELPIVHEDDALIAVSKPPLLPVHPTARYHQSTVVMALERARPGERPTLLHRLDRETSGLLLLARTRAADRAVKMQFEARRNVVKRYLAIAWGRPDWREIGCDEPLEPDAASPFARVKMRVAPRGSGLEAATTFELRDVRRSPGGRSYSLLCCTLHTGRQHQIRVHLAALGLPVVGDKLYGPDEELFARGAAGTLTAADRARLELDRHALHAHELEIDHPSDGRRLRLEAPLWADLAGFWQSLA